MSIQTPQRPDVGGPPPPPVQPPRRGVSIGAVTLGIVLVVLGVVALLVALDVDVPLYLVGPGVLVVVGIGVMVSGIRGERDGGGLGFAIFLGIVVALASLAVALLEVPLGGGIGDRSHEATAVEALQDEYRWGIGDLTVDLRDADLDVGTTEVEVSVAIGQLEVIVPEGMAVEVDAQVAGGAIEVFGYRMDGVGIDSQRRTDGFDDADRRLSLVVRVGFGEAHVVVR
jgi:hypothetical protein